MPITADELAQLDTLTREALAASDQAARLTAWGAFLASAATAIELDPTLLNRVEAALLSVLEQVDGRPTGKDTRPSAQAARQAMRSRLATGIPAMLRAVQGDMDTQATAQSALATSKLAEVNTLAG